MQVIYVFKDTSTWHLNNLVVIVISNAGTLSENVQ